MDKQNVSENGWLSDLAPTSLILRCEPEG
jgi:hypothetical protein